jgi:hypothetical protein
MQCSPFDMDRDIRYTCGLGKEKEDEPQEVDYRGEIAGCACNTQ